MAVAVCGKRCDECAFKEKLVCPGCEDGPGRAWSGECELAKCCREKGHESCDTCSFSSSCGKLRRKGSEPEDRLRRRAAEEERKKKILQKSEFLGKWLWILFWLVIPSVAASLMTEDHIVEWFPALLLPGQILNVLCLAAYGVVLLRMSPENERYQTAGICSIVSGGVGTLVVMLAGRSEAPGWTLVLTLPVAAVSLVGKYNEYIGHSEVLSDIDTTLSEKWEKLWKWFLGTLLGMLGSVIVMLIAPILGLLVFLAASIGTIIVNILTLVYLYRAAKVFQEYPQSVE